MTDETRLLREIVPDVNENYHLRFNTRGVDGTAIFTRQAAVYLGIRSRDDVTVPEVVQRAEAFLVQRLARWDHDDFWVLEGEASDWYEHSAGVHLLRTN